MYPGLGVEEINKFEMLTSTDAKSPEEPGMYSLEKAKHLDNSWSM